MMTEKTEFTRPLSRTALVRDLPARELEASADERRALAERFALAEIGRLWARLAVEHLDERGLLRVSGELEAQFSELCVVTGAPIPRRLETSFEQLFTLAPSRAAPGEEVFVDDEGEDPPEPVGAEGLDLGEIVVQEFALHLEPFPRAPEAQLEQTTWGADGEVEPPAEGAFAALRNWRR